MLDQLHREFNCPWGTSGDPGQPRLCPPVGPPWQALRMSKASCPNTTYVHLVSHSFYIGRVHPEIHALDILKIYFFVGMSFLDIEFSPMDFPVLKDDLQQIFLLLFCLDIQCQILGAIGSSASSLALGILLGKEILMRMIGAFGVVCGYWCGASWSTVVEEGKPVDTAGSGATTSAIRVMTSGAG
ncbi:hypothetical protein Tco_0657367 [Tanacetum coccineum]|uniref:Uncharacterized protein n=1 Tax=Tanacetum coccineum TaxID=301880 RepID=A0ABQ4XC63_9ASTR